MKHTLSVADRIGIGFAAGLVGTLVMTLGQRAEMKLSGRASSPTPAKAVEKVSGVELASDADEQRASWPIHFGYGTLVGGALAGLDDVPEPVRTGTFFALAWRVGASLLSGLKLAPPPSEQKPAALATDLGHHLVYAVSAGTAYAWLSRLAERRHR